MDFIKFALEMEDQTKQYYTNLAQKCVSNEGVKNILTMLANEHDKHGKTFEMIKNDSCSEMEKTSSFEEVKYLFSSMKESKKAFSCDIDQVELYKKALNLVSKKFNFYRDAMDQVECPDSRNILKQIVKEEKHQMYVLENIIEMIARPASWVEDAEFYHFDEY